MNRDHLRLVAASSAPCSVTMLESLSFAQVEGGLVIMHDDKRITPLEALDVLWTFAERLRPALLRGPADAADAELKLRMLPGDMVEAERAAADILFAENRHQRGYPVERPRPICAETEGDMA